MKKLIAMLAAVLCLAMLPAVALADYSEATPVGTWDVSAATSDSVTAKLYEIENGKYHLEITGTGSMMDWSSDSSVPWKSKREQIVSITISDGVTNVGKYAFHWCSSLQSIQIADSVKTIGNSSFYKCLKLTTVALPPSLEKVGSVAFQGCTRLTGIVFPATVKDIQFKALYDCPALISIVFLGKTTEPTSSSIPSTTNATIYGHKGSKAESYSIANGIPFIAFPVASPTSIDFGNAGVGYDQPAAATVTITHAGTETITIKQPTAKDYAIGQLSRTSLDGTNKTATFTVQPKAALGVDKHEEVIEVFDGADVKIAEVFVTFTVLDTHTVSFDANGGTGSMADMVFVAGETKALTPNAFSKVGYAFDGWSGGYEDGASVAPSSDMTLYAQWKPIAYSIRFDVNGGEGTMSDQAFSYDESKALSPSAFSKLGHSLEGWSTERNGSGTSYSDGATVSNLTSTEGAAVTLYAQWKPNSYTVTFDVDGGSDVSSQTVEYGKAASEPQDPEKPGYAFAGWYADAELTAEYDFSSPVTAPTTIYAKWDVAYYPIIVPTPKPCPLDGYEDLDKSAWYHDGVHWAIESGIMTGTRDAAWEPGSATTRAMVATVLYRMEGEPNATGEGAWHADAMDWAVERGIFRGYENNPLNLGEHDPVTREQLATVLWRYVQLKGVDASVTADLSIFPDADSVTAWALDAMRWAVSEGVITGRGGTLLAPAGETERAELATMIWRL